VTAIHHSRAFLLKFPDNNVTILVEKWICSTSV
jgi:hypothetical protein